MLRMILACVNAHSCTLWLGPLLQEAPAHPQNRKMVIPIATQHTPTQGLKRSPAAKNSSRFLAGLDQRKDRHSVCRSSPTLANFQNNPLNLRSRPVNAQSLFPAVVLIATQALLRKGDSPCSF